jgi:hypothetical protein
MIEDKLIEFLGKTLFNATMFVGVITSCVHFIVVTVIKISEQE